MKHKIHLKQIHNINKCINDIECVCYKAMVCINYTIYVSITKLLHYYIFVKICIVYSMKIT